MAYRVTSEAFLRPISVASAMASTDPGNKGGGAPQVGKCHPSGQPSTPRAASRPSNRLNFGRSSCVRSARVVFLGHDAFEGLLSTDSRACRGAKREVIDLQRDADEARSGVAK